MADAVKQVEAWLEAPVAVLLHEGVGYWDELQRQLFASQARGPLVHDARIAALCIDHGVTELWTVDRDFSRFPALPIRNPLMT